MRQRKDPADAWLPSRVYRGKAAYEWHTPGGKTVRLCRLDSTAQTVLDRYNEAIAVTPPEDTVSWLAAKYFESKKFARLSETTQADYRQCSKLPLALMGKAKAAAITPRHISAYMDDRSQDSLYRANRELSWLKAVYSFGCARGYVTKHPCQFLEPIGGEKRRTGYVTHDVYREVYSRAPAPIQVAMELAYCTGLRPADILAMQWRQITPEGILVRHIKTYERTGKEFLKEITPRVQAALDLAKTLPKPKTVICPYVVRTRSGRRYTRSGFNSVWQRIGAGFQFYDLKRSGTTDFAGEKKSDFTGHESERMAQSYNVKPIKSPSH